MQVSVESTSELERRMTISVPSDAFEGQVSDRLKEAAGRVRVDGFRPGKVPLKEVRRRFGTAVRQEVASEVMQSSFVDAIRQEELSPAGSPALEVVNLDAGGDLEFTATFEVFPEVVVADLSEVHVKRPEAAVTDDDIEAMVDRLREQRKTYQETERAAEDGDRVTVTFVGRLDGEEFEGNRGEDVPFIIGQGQMIESFETNVAGMAAGEEKTFVATFPDDYPNDTLKGKDVEFEVSVSKVEAPEIPELDEEFFKSFGVEEGGEETFRAEILDNMQNEMKAAVQNQVKSQVLEELERLHDINLPHALVHREVHVLKDQMFQRMQMISRDGNRPSLPDEMFEPDAKKRVAIGLIVNQIVNDNEFKPDADKVRERIEEMAKPYDQPEQVVNWYYANEEQLQQVEMAVLEDQVVDYVLSLANVEPIASTYDDVVSGRAVAPEPETEAPEADAQAPETTQADADAATEADTPEETPDKEA